MLFYNLKLFYLIDESILVEFDAKPESEKDWVGLFPLGWKSLEDHITFEWVAESLALPWADGKSESKSQGLLFHPQFHARQVSDLVSYQFVYVTLQIEVLAVSAAFKFQIENFLENVIERPFMGFLQPIKLKSRGNSKQRKSIYLADLLNTLETESTVKISIGDREIFIKKLNPDEMNSEGTTPQGNDEKYKRNFTGFLSEMRSIAEDHLMKWTQTLMEFFKPGDENAPDLSVPYPEESEIYGYGPTNPKKIVEIFKNPALTWE